MKEVTAVSSGQAFVLSDAVRAPLKHAAMSHYRRKICTALVMLGAPALMVHTQERVRRVAYVWLFSYGPSAPYPSAFRTRMRELGWIEGRGIEVKEYDAEGDFERLAAIMKRLVDEKVDVIVGSCTPEGRAAAKATQSIPIVMAATGDPVAAGLARSLAKPSGNVTGVSSMGLDLSAKRFDILKEAFPRLSQATIVFNPERTDNVPEVQTMRVAATTVGVRSDTLEVRTINELNEGLDLLPDSTQALLNAGDNLLNSNAKRLVGEAAKRRIPALFEDRIYVDQGGLMSYGPNIARMHARAADYVDRILKGVRPADLPIEQPTKFELAVNLRTAKALGFTIPHSVLLRADEVLR
jgi:putative tryptophan/tyrosine transport system substrate-binding protein